MEDDTAQKGHHARRAGAKADKKKSAQLRKKHGAALDGGAAAESAAAADKERQKGSSKNHKAFGLAHYGRVHKTMQRNRDRAHHKERGAKVDRTTAAEVLPPVVVVVMGPPRTGKTTLIKVRELGRGVLCRVC